MLVDIALAMLLLQRKMSMISALKCFLMGGA